MSFLSDEKDKILEKIHELKAGFDEARKSINKELAENLADADRDFGYFRQDTPLNENELRDISDRMRLRATQFEAEHPKLSAVFREFAELLRGMGV